MKKPQQAEIAKAMGVTPKQITKKKGQGMPVTSIAAALEWNARRKGIAPRGDGATPPGELPVVNPVAPEIAQGMIGELEGRIKRAKRLADSAQDRAQSEIESGDGEAAKRAGDLASSSQKTLLLLERELRQRRIDAGELVPKMAALESFGKIVAEILATIDAGENAFCIESNPDNPGRASKAFRRFRDAVRRKVSASMP